MFLLNALQNILHSPKYCCRDVAIVALNVTSVWAAVGSVVKSSNYQVSPEASDRLPAGMAQRLTPPGPAEGGQKNDVQLLANG